MTEESLADYVAILEQENKELKHRNENLRIALSTYEMPEVVKVLTDYRTGELQLQEKRLNKYRSALKKIKDLCTHYENTNDKCVINCYAHFIVTDLIQDKINEVLNESN